MQAHGVKTLGEKTSMGFSLWALQQLRQLLSRWPHQQWVRRQVQQEGGGGGMGLCVSWAAGATGTAGTAGAAGAAGRRRNGITHQPIDTQAQEAPTQTDLMFHTGEPTEHH